MESISLNQKITTKKATFLLPTDKAENVPRSTINKWWFLPSKYTSMQKLTTSHVSTATTHSKPPPSLLACTMHTASAFALGPPVCAQRRSWLIPLTHKSDDVILLLKVPQCCLSHWVNTKDIKMVSKSDSIVQLHRISYCPLGPHAPLPTPATRLPILLPTTWHTAHWATAVPPLECFSSRHLRSASSQPQLLTYMSLSAASLAALRNIHTFSKSLPCFISP